MLTMEELKLRGKRVLIREDLNVPMKDGDITDDTRLKAALPTIRQAMAAGAKVMVMSHLGRPKEGVFDASFSLRPVAERMAQLLGKPVPLASDWLQGVTLSKGDVVLCENVRFLVGENANDDGLARAMAASCDIFVNDAFATAHRAQASTHGIAKYAKTVCAGPLMVAELEALGKALAEPEPPVVGIVGGAKVSTKLEMLESLLTKVDRLIVGGGIANTFLLAAGFNIGRSLHEAELVDVARSLLRQAKAQNKEIPMPRDVVCAKEFSEQAAPECKPVGEVAPDDLILDIGPATAGLYRELVADAGTIVWNGPVGVFEWPAFADGTKQIAEAIAASPAFSIAGGGDTLAAIAKFDVGSGISYISTGGGAFLEFLEGKRLPAIAILEERERANPDVTHLSEGY